MKKAKTLDELLEENKDDPEFLLGCLRLEMENLIAENTRLKLVLKVKFGVHRVTSTGKIIWDTETAKKLSFPHPPEVDL